MDFHVRSQRPGHAERSPELAPNVRRETIAVATVEEATTKPPLGLRVS
jgi:hypothetical protein